MSAKKITAEEEIDKQYREYKEQFETWKENNKHAVGSEAYNKYVLQFQNWEKEVEKRKAALKRNQEHERPSEQTDEAAAKAYAAQQEQYLRMHQKGMQEDALKNRTKRPAFQQSPSSRDAQTALLSSLTNALTNVIKTAGNRSPADALKPPAAATQAATISAPPVLASQAPVAAVQPNPEIVKPPQLWWSQKPAYGPHDKLFRLFGPLAAPTTTKVTVPEGKFSPGWLVQREMSQQRLRFYDPSMIVSIAPHPSETDQPIPIPRRKVIDIKIPINFNIPPPNFNLNVPPPTINQNVSIQQPPPSMMLPPVFNPRVPPPPLPMAIPQMVQAGMKRNHSFPGRQEPMQIHG